MGPVTINDVFVPNVTVERMFEHLMAILAAKKGVRLERPAPDVLTIHYRHAVWNNDTTTVLGRDVKGGAKFTATGASSQWVKNRLNRALGIPGYGPPLPPPHSGPVGAKRVAQLTDPQHRKPSEQEPAPSSPVGDIERLADLHARGVLTDEEFDLAK